MKYKVEFSSQSKKFIKSLYKKEALRLLNKFEEVKKNPFRYLRHYEGKGYKQRIGDYRALIDINFKRKILYVRIIDKRGRIYKR